MNDFQKTILLAVILITLIGLAVLMIIKPQQEKITDEILQEKRENESTYLDFIANNLAGGGPPKDGIPAVDEPVYLTPAEAEAQDNLKDDDIVFGIDFGGKVIAYSQAIMYWHEIANEKTEDGREFSVTYCPLTGSVIGYLDHNLGVSGKLYNSNLVMYDRKTDSYYPQMLGQAIDGPDKGTVMETFDVEVTTWGQWKAAHPDTQVLSRDTGYSRTYDDPPYQGYDTAYLIWFDVAAESDRFHTKKLIHGVEHDGQVLTVVKENVPPEGLEYATPNDKLFITYNEALGTVQVNAESGQEVKNYDAYWFAWYAYHPETIVINE